MGHKSRTVEGLGITLKIATFTANRFAMAVLFALLAVIKMPIVTLHGRLWAEEGKVFLADMFNRGLPGALTYKYLGTIQIPTALTMWVTAHLPRLYMPLLPTYVAVAAALFVFLQMLDWAERHHVPPVATLALLVAWFFLPESFEIWATATNLQWINSVSMLFVLLIERERLARRLPAWSAWALLCGLDGVPSCMLTPMFLYRGYAERSRPHAIVGIILGVCACLQLVLIAQGGTGERHFSVNLLDILPAVAVQTVIVPIFGTGLMDHLLDYIASLDWPWVITFRIGLCALAVGIVAAVLRLTANNRVHYREAWLIVAAWLLVSMLNASSSLDGANRLIAPTNGARYFFFGATALCLLVALACANARTARGRTLCLGILVVIAAFGIGARFFQGWPEYFLTGPDWQSQVASCPANGPCDIQIWPGDPQWKLTLPPETRP